MPAVDCYTTAPKWPQLQLHPTSIAFELEHALHCFACPVTTTAQKWPQSQPHVLCSASTACCQLFLTILSHACTALPVLQLDCYAHGTKVASVAATANGVASGAMLGIFRISSIAVVLHQSAAACIHCISYTTVFATLPHACSWTAMTTVPKWPQSLPQPTASHLVQCSASIASLGAEV
jgi:hypothetical protein